MCGNSGLFHGKLFSGAYIGATRANRPAPVDPQILADQQASIAASEAAAAWNKRRVASALSVGSRAVVGQPSALGAAAATPATRGVSSTSSAMGAAAGGNR